MSDCIKCGNSDVLTKYVAEGGLINSSSTKEINNQFIRSVEYGYFYKLLAAKEHLYIVCSNCRYSWREDTNDHI